MCIKRYLLALFFILLVRLSFGQTVQTKLTAWHQGQAVGLDSITLFNLENGYKKTLSSLPEETTTYTIDFLSGMVNIAQDPGNVAAGVYRLLNVPGRFGFSVCTKRSENICIAVYNVMGQLMEEFIRPVTAGGNSFELQMNYPQLCIISVACSQGRYSFKALGAGTEQSFSLYYSGASDEVLFPVELKGSPVLFSDWQFTPGDKIRLAVYRKDYYSNLIEIVPENGDRDTVFLSVPCPDTPVVADYDGNVYNTVQIGSQCWMKENLNTTHYADGEEIELIRSLEELGSNYSRFCCDYDCDPDNGRIYGKLYNWGTIMRGAASSVSNPSGVQGVCPDGWHVPSMAEWEELAINLGVSPVLIENLGLGKSNIGGMLKSTGTEYWRESYGTTNSSGLSILPSGVLQYYTSQGWFFYDKGARAYIATTNANSQLTWKKIKLGFDTKIEIIEGGYTLIICVRCIKDKEE